MQIAITTRRTFVNVAFCILLILLALCFRVHAEEAQVGHQTGNMERGTTSNARQEAENTNKQRQTLNVWTGGWSGNVIRWLALGVSYPDTIDDLVLDKNLKFVAIRSKWQLKIFALTDQLEIGKQIFDSNSLDSAGVFGCAWVKDGVVFWGQNRFATYEQFLLFDGDINRMLDESGRIWLWQVQDQKAKVLFSSSLCTAASNPTGDTIVFFGRGGKVRLILPPGLPTGGEIPVGRFELYDVTNGKIVFSKEVSEWGRYTDLFSHAQWPYILKWTSQDTLFLVDQREQILKVESVMSRNSTFAPVLYAMSLSGNAFPLTDFDTQVLVFPDASVSLLDDDMTVACKINDAPSPHASKSSMAFYSKSGLIQKFDNIFVGGGISGLDDYTITPDGGGIIYQYIEHQSPSSGNLYDIIAWNWIEKKAYSLGTVNTIHTAFSWVNNQYLPLVIRKPQPNGTDVLIPCIIEVKKDENAKPYNWKGLPDYLGHKKGK